MSIQSVIETANIRIVSGEGEQGTIEPYTGDRTAQAIKLRLEKERCGGDRWARAEYERTAGQYEELPIEAAE